MNPVLTISRKRDGRELTPEEIGEFVKGFSDGAIPDYQMSALAMAIYFKGMTSAEIAALTGHMLASGRKLSWGQTLVPSLNLTEPEPPPIAVDEEVTAFITMPKKAGAQQDSASGEQGTPPGRATLLLDGTRRIDSRPDLAVGGRDTVEIEDFFVAPPIASSTPMGDTADMLARFELASTGRDTVDFGQLSDSSPKRKLAFLGPVVDKHSTGGLGDKVSLVLAPLLACCGLRVPMLSGRGLGATGGTLDKLESIRGFRTNLTIREITDITNQIGCVITGTTDDLAPADRKLYALRDVTGTVASIPLITASIMSKKLAEGLNALVLDVKFGSGAFMKSLSAARKLAASLVETGQRMGVRTSALLTNMDQPLGRMVGNTLEVDEAVDVLAGRGPADVWEVTKELAADLLLTTGVAGERDEARRVLDDHLQSGRALARFIAMVAAQGGDLNAPRPRCATQAEIVAARTGYVSRINTESLGFAVIELGGGRRVMSDKVDHGVGLEMLVRLGDHVELGQPLVRVFAPPKKFAIVKPLVRNAIQIRLQPVKPPPLISERME